MNIQTNQKSTLSVWINIQNLKQISYFCKKLSHYIHIYRTCRNISSQDLIACKLKNNLLFLPMSLMKSAFLIFISILNWNPKKSVEKWSSSSWLWDELNVRDPSKFFWTGNAAILNKILCSETSECSLSRTTWMFCSLEFSLLWGNTFKIQDVSAKENVGLGA